MLSTLGPEGAHHGRSGARPGIADSLDEHQRFRCSWGAVWAVSGCVWPDHYSPTPVIVRCVASVDACRHPPRDPGPFRARS